MGKAIYSLMQIRRSYDSLWLKFRITHHLLVTVSQVASEVGQLSQYSNGLWGLMAEVQCLARARDFSLLQCPEQLWGPTQPPIQWVSGALSPG
jgi:hypothetical protein